MSRRAIGVVLIVALTALVPLARAQTDPPGREQDHDELRAVMATVVDAVNNRNAEALTPMLHDSFSITMVDQTQLSSLDEMRRYFAETFESDDAILESVRIEPEADVLTEFLGDNVGFNHGRSTDTYTLKGGREVVLDSRWTATVIKDDGRWKLVGVHAGVNMLDNPILTATEWKKQIWGGGGLIVGAMIGGLAISLRRKR